MRTTANSLVPATHSTLVHLHLHQLCIIFVHVKRVKNWSRRPIYTRRALCMLFLFSFEKVIISIIQMRILPIAL